jgi:hypothetical protein
VGRLDRESLHQKPLQTLSLRDLLWSCRLSLVASFVAARGSAEKQLQTLSAPKRISFAGKGTVHKCNKSPWHSRSRRVLITQRSRVRIPQPELFGVFTFATDFLGQVRLILAFSFYVLRDLRALVFRDFCKVKLKMFPHVCEENFPKQRKTDTLLSVPFFKSPRFVHFFVAIFAFFAALPRIF